MSESKMFEKKLERLKELRAERDSGDAAALEKAEVAVIGARAEANEARVAAIVDPTTAPAAVAAEKKLEAALEARDQIAGRAELLDAAIKRLEGELSAAASASRDATLEAAKAAALERLVKARDAVEAAAVDAVLVWALNKRGPIMAGDIAPALAEALDLELEAIRQAGFAALDAIKAEAHEPFRRLAEAQPQSTPASDDVEVRAAHAQALSRPSYVESEKEV